MSAAWSWCGPTATWPGAPTRRRRSRARPSSACAVVFCPRNRIRILFSRETISQRPGTTGMPKRKPISAPAPAGSRIFPVYIAIELGGESKRALVQALDRDGCYVGHCAQEMIAQASFATAEGPRTITLARVQLSTLGVTGWVAWSDVLKAAAKVGAQKVPA